MEILKNNEMIKLLKNNRNCFENMNLILIDNTMKHRLDLARATRGKDFLETLPLAGF